MKSHPLLDITLPRTLDAWVSQFEQPEWHGAEVEGWLFEGVAARRDAEKRLAAAGVQAQLRSAYKPLLHYFLEEIDCDTLAAVTLHYPVHPNASPRRFLLEAYPLAGLLPDCKLEFVPGSDDLHYQLALTLRDGSHRQISVFAPNRIHIDHIDATLLSPTGWLRARKQPDLEARLDSAHKTDYEQLFELIVQTVKQHPWPAQEPYFERLDIRVDLPGIEQALAVDHECISSHEALHEDIYFSLLEIFQRHSGRPAHDRRLQPGQIVPDVRLSHTAPCLSICLNSFDTKAQDLCAHADADPEQALDLLDTAPHPKRIAAEMANLGGQRFAALSRQGRQVHGLYQAGPGAAVVISGGQHANETSGVLGALRAARVLQARESTGDKAHFALIALENPDGYALHRELCVQHPGHMHHAARYSALGDDIEYREQAPLYEREAREKALALSSAQLHINLHGYPAHEWTRPLSGYVPRGFELWTIPKGFFLILRHHTGWQAEGRALLEHVSAALAKVPGLSAYNARQMALYERHAGELPFEVINGSACTQSEVNHRGAPITLITEFPDETVEGERFRFAHTVQMETVLAAVRAWQGLARK
ncbi:peptidase M14 [Polaromonas sp. SM01]|uniref:peptidase M14 n=1 Tax=Polaromonas sp. SM01 TaxID=3085630 RepID=UPI002981968D|nr:peptidase M14 [Polaromonas sp. SM01]MDW5444574.1 peptidase M14 [Polaromonas sp. SM01]